MIRTIGAAAFLAVAASMPVQQATAQDALGGALLGGAAGAIIGGAATGRAGGALVGGIIGGAAGAIIGAEAQRRRAYYWWRGNCYRAVQGGYVMVRRNYCY